MTVVASSVAALQLLRSYKCPHCGAEQRRFIPRVGQALQCTNCLKTFSPSSNQLERHVTRRRKR